MRAPAEGDRGHDQLEGVDLDLDFADRGCLERALVRLDLLVWRKCPSLPPLLFVPVCLVVQYAHACGPVNPSPPTPAPQPLTPTRNTNPNTSPHLIPTPIPTLTAKCCVFSINSFCVYYSPDLDDDRNVFRSYYWFTDALSISSGVFFVTGSYLTIRQDSRSVAQVRTVNFYCIYTLHWVAIRYMYVWFHTAYSTSSY